MEWGERGKVFFSLLKGYATGKFHEGPFTKKKAVMK